MYGQKEASLRRSKLQTTLTVQIAFLEIIYRAAISTSGTLKYPHPSPLLSLDLQSSQDSLFGKVIEHKDENWLTRPLVYQAFYHPVRHFLLMHFLGYTAETFFTGSIGAFPFGKGPWPCLNPTCQHYHQSCIEHCTITRFQQNKRPLRRLRGEFTCTCGFAYIRFGPDEEGEDQLQLSKVMTYGSVWEAALREWWNNPSFSQEEMSRKLGVGAGTLLRQAARLGLAFPRPGSRLISPEKYQYINHSRRPWVIDPETLTRCRKEWVATRETHPEAGITFLIQQVPKIYRWLRKHDPDWLKTHLPARKSSCPSSSKGRVDWEQRDKQWAIAIKSATLRLKGLPGHPIQITRVAIARELGQPKSVLYTTELEKLPLTKKALEGNLEDTEAYAVRRIRWAATLYQQEHLLPTKTQLLLRSGALSQWKLPLVQQASGDALHTLRGQGSSNY